MSILICRLITLCVGESAYIDLPINNAYLKRFVEEFNKSCPTRISSTIQIDEAELLPNKIVKFNHTFLKTSPILQTYYASKIYMSAMEIYHLKTIHGESFRPLREMGVKFLFAYHDEKGAELFRQLLEPEYYNSIPQTDIPKSGDDMIVHSLNAIKKQLPITDPNSGIIVVDAVGVDSIMICTAIIPDKLNEEVIRHVGLDVFRKQQTVVVCGNKSLSSLIHQGYSVKYIYLKENTEKLLEINITQDNIEDIKKETEASRKEKARLTAYLSAYLINRTKGDENPEDDAIITDSYVSNDTLYTVLRLSDSFIEQTDPESFYFMTYSSIRTNLRGEAEVLDMLKNGIKVSYIYQTTQGKPFQAVTLDAEDIFIEEEKKNSEVVLQMMDRIQSILPYENEKAGLYINSCKLLDGVVYLEGIITNKMSEEELAEVNTYAKDRFKKMIETTPTWKDIVLEGISFNFLFTDKEGKDLLNVTVSSEDFLEQKE